MNAPVDVMHAGAPAIEEALRAFGNQRNDGPRPLRDSKGVRGSVLHCAHPKAYCLGRDLS